LLHDCFDADELCRRDDRDGLAFAREWHDADQCDSAGDGSYAGNELLLPGVRDKFLGHDLRCGDLLHVARDAERRDECRHERYV
jgi:hypothetical protein